MQGGPSLTLVPRSMTGDSEAIKTGSYGTSGALPASGRLGAIRQRPEDLGWSEGRLSRACRLPAVERSVLWSEEDGGVVLALISFRFIYSFIYLFCNYFLGGVICQLCIGNIHKTNDG